MNADSNLLDRNKVELSLKYVNYTIFESITESVDVSNDLEQVKLHLFRNKLSVLVLHEYLGHVPDKIELIVL